jgi:hypothetical protein
VSCFDFAEYVQLRLMLTLFYLFIVTHTTRWVGSLYAVYLISDSRSRSLKTRIEKEIEIYNIAGAAS